jgi:phosphoglycolate phosphatase
MTPTYIFDLDGTLVDTAPDLLDALNALMVRERRRTFARKEIDHMVGRGAEVLIEEAFRRSGAPMAPSRIEGLLADYLVEYHARLAAKSRPYPGVVETLEALQAQGAPMGVLTNKPREMTEELLPSLRLSRFFGAVYGAGKRPYIKPDPRLFAEILAELGGSKKSAVMVGDSVTDVKTARNAGVPVILLSYGYTPEPAATLRADAVLDRFSDVPAAAAMLLGL